MLLQETLHSMAYYLLLWLMFQYVVTVVANSLTAYFTALVASERIIGTRWVCLDGFRPRYKNQHLVKDRT